MWKKLQFNDIRTYLAKDELDKLQTYSIDEDFTNVVETTLDMVADLFRGVWQAKGYDIDVREHYICTTYLPFILAYTRWILWNRFPNAGEYALTETRKSEYDEAVELLKNPYIGVEDPADINDPDNPNNKVKQVDSAISIPYLRMDDPYIGFSYNFQEKFNETI